MYVRSNNIHGVQSKTRCAQRGKTNCSMPLRKRMRKRHTPTHTHKWNVKCIRKLENTKTLGTNEQYYVRSIWHCILARMDFRKIKKLLVMKCRGQGTQEASSDTQMERRKSNGARLQQYFLCRWYLFILFGFFPSSVQPRRVIDVSA